MDEARRYVQATANYMAGNLSIIDKASHKVRLIPNCEQQRLLYAIGTQQAMGLPARVLGLKARRIGFSTATVGLFFSDCVLRRHRKAFTCAHTSLSTDTLWSMARVMESELPAAQKRRKEASSKTEIRWAPPHYSHYQVHTAGSPEVGRSQEIHDLHGSEVAFWPHAQKSLTALMSAVSDEPDTMAILESTANGVGGEFYDRYVMAIERMRAHPDDYAGFLPLFFSWLQFPEYRRELPRGYSLGHLDDDEQFLRTLGADDEQLYWRRRTLEQKCGGDPSTFKQEFPATWEEAFQFSGRQAIPQGILAHHNETAAPGRRVRLIRDGQSVHAESYDGDGPCWEFWEDPREYHDYAVGADVAKGLLADPMDEDSDPDYHAAFVLDRREMSQAAEWHGRSDTDLFGVELLKAGLYFNQAYVGVDATGGYGIAAMTPMRDYPHLYRRTNPPDSVQEQEIARYGIVLTSATRDPMIDAWIAACRRDPVHEWEGKVTVRSPLLVSEEMTFVTDKRGKRQHRPGRHDDALFGGILAVEVHNHAPRQHGEVTHPSSIPMVQAIEAQGISALARVGAVDPGLATDQGDD